MNPLVPTGSTGVWSAELRYGDGQRAVEAAAELESLGYAALWVPDVGGDLFARLAALLGATRSISVATGILNLWLHPAAEVVAARAGLVAAHGDRLLLGIGVSHAALIDAAGPARYGRPLAATAAFLDGLDAAGEPVPADRRVLAALGPGMLALAGRRTAGTHSYNVTPEHTAAARAALGPGALVLPEQAVVLDTDAGRARTAGREHLAVYLSLPNYTNNLRRLGFGDDDLDHGGSDRLVDALVAWGDEAAVAARVDEHRRAGADHVCVQVLGAGDLPLDQWRRLAPVLCG